MSCSWIQCLSLPLQHQTNKQTNIEWWCDAKMEYSTSPCSLMLQHGLQHQSMATRHIFTGKQWVNLMAWVNAYTYKTTAFSSQLQMPPAATSTQVTNPHWQPSMLMTHGQYILLLAEMQWQTFIAQSSANVQISMHSNTPLHHQRLTSHETTNQTFGSQDPLLVIQFSSGVCPGPTLTPSKDVEISQELVHQIWS